MPSGGPSGKLGRWVWIAAAGYIHPSPCWNNSRNGHRSRRSRRFKPQRFMTTPKDTPAAPASSKYPERENLFQFLLRVSENNSYAVADLLSEAPPFVIQKADGEI